jgi:HAD superfamily hydrolase (TIGR01549 family)
MTKAILFDLYGVLRQDIYEAWLSKHDLKREGVYQELSEKVDANMLDQPGFISALSLHSGVDETSIVTDFQSFSSIDPSVFDLLDLLGQTYKLGLISNGSIHTRERLIREKLIDYFDAVIISAEVGFIKPNKEIYEKALESLEVLPDEVLYTDDNPKNIVGAERLGIPSVLFTDLDAFITELKRRKTI